MKKYNQLNAMLAISKASFRSITRSPSAVIFTLVFPMIFIMVFGFLKEQKVSLDFAIDPTSSNENPIFYSLISSPSIAVIPGLKKEEQEQMLRKGKIDGIIRIVEHQVDGNTHYELNLYTSLSNPEKTGISRSVLEHIVDKSNLLAAQVKQPNAILKLHELPGRKYSAIDFILPGQLGFSLLSSGVFGTAFVFFNMRQTLVLKRFFATPIKKPYIILGETLSRMTFALLGAAFLVLVGYFCFGFTLINGWITFLTMLLLSAIGLIVFMGFGFVVSGIAKSESTIPPLANIVTLPQFLLSGTFFGIEHFPSWLQPICKLLPLTYLNDAMRKVAYEGAGITDIGFQLFVIFAWGIAIYALAVKCFRWE